VADESDELAALIMCVKNVLCFTPSQECIDFYIYVTCCLQGCGRLKTPFEHATKVCSKYRERVRRLSGFGMQISPAARKILLTFLFIVHLQFIPNHKENL
jgi:hypothetical protein